MPSQLTDFLEYASYDGHKVDVKKLVNTTEDQLKETILNRQDCILFGPPGTSKTYLIDRLPILLGGAMGLSQTIQFHSNYSYEDFIEGIVPSVDEHGFKYEDGVFFKFCNKAKEPQYEGKVCVFVIDEINRANVTAVFGEVLNLIENKGTRKLVTAKRKIEFSIPKNVVIVGTMNTADKTLAKLDFAFRRRFKFLAVFPSKTELHKMIAKDGFAEDVGITVDEYVSCFEILNTKILKHPMLGKNLTLGHVLWTRKNVGSEKPYSKNEIAGIFRETILPQLENYCGSNREVLGSLIGVELRDKIIYGYEISDDEILNFLTGLKNCRVVDS